MQNEVSTNGRSDKARKGENIGDGIDVFMGSERFYGFQDFEGFLEGCGWGRWLFAVIAFALGLFMFERERKGWNPIRNPSLCIQTTLKFT